MKWHRVVQVFIALLFVLSVALPASAQSEVMVTTRDNAQLRSGPDRSYGSLGVVPFNTTLPATGRSEDSSWIQVEYNGTVGWIAQFLVNWTGNLDSLPVGGIVAAAPPAPPAAGEVVLPAGAVSATNANAINVRSAPNTGATPLGQLPAGTTIGLNGRWGSGSGMWVRFDFNGQPAWVAGWLLRIDGDANALPDIQAAQNVVLGLCGGGSAPEAAAYNPGAGVHPIVLLNETGGTHTWNGQLGNWGVGRTPGSAELVGCLSAEERVVLQTCEYYGPNITRYVYQINLRLIVAQTGQVIASTTLQGDSPRTCRSQEPWDLTVLNGSHVTIDQLRGWLQPYVNP